VQDEIAKASKKLPIEKEKGKGEDVEIMPRSQVMTTPFLEAL